LALLNEQTLTVTVKVRVGVGVGDEVRVSFSLGVCPFEIVLAQISIHK